MSTNDELILKRIRQNWKYDPKPSDSPERATDRLLEACRQQLLKSQQSAVSDDVVRSFAWVTLDVLADKGRSLRRHDIEYVRDNYCKMAFPVYFAMHTAAEWAKSGFDATDNAKWRHLALEFFEAAETRPGTLAKDVKDFRRREVAFLSRRDLDDSQFKHVVQQIMGLSVTEYEKLLKVANVRKWRTYDDERLREIGKNFARWRRVVDTLGRPDTWTSEFRDRIGSLKKRIANAVLSSWRGAREDVESQIDGAFANKLSRYSYEAGLPTFLCKVVLNALKQLDPRPDATGGDKKVVDKPEIDEGQKWVELLDDYISRYYLVACTFTPKIRPVLNVVWRAVLDKARGGRLGDAVRDDLPSVAPERTTETTGAGSAGRMRDSCDGAVDGRDSRYCENDLGETKHCDCEDDDTDYCEDICVDLGESSFNHLVTERVKAELGEDRTPGNVSLLRNRLKMRMSCVTFILNFDELPTWLDMSREAGQWRDLPGDKSLFEWIDRTAGQTDQLQAIRRLASLARASRYLKDRYHVIRAVLAHESPERDWRKAVAVFLQSQRNVSKGMGEPSTQASVKLNRLRDVDPRKLATVRQVLRNHDVKFYEDAFLILGVGEKMSVKAILETLNASVAESTGIGHAYDVL